MRSTASTVSGRCTSSTTVLTFLGRDFFGIRRIGAIRLISVDAVDTCGSIRKIEFGKRGGKKD